jgi:hypothetical protein
MRCTPWQDEVMTGVGPGDVANDVGEGADAVQIVGARFAQLRIALEQDADLPLFAHGLLCGGDRLRSRYRDRDNDVRKQHGVAYRDNDESIIWNRN